VKNIVLIACSGSKLETVNQATNLYTGELFKLSKRYAQGCFGGIHEWMILSAKHGLVNPLEYLEPYNETLDTVAKRKEWGGKVVQQLDDRYRGYSKHEMVRFIILAGNDYCHWTYDPMPLTWAATTRPLQGMGIGQQKAALGRMIDSLNADKHAWPHIALSDRVERSLSAIYVSGGTS
jgi:hypothetical protein